MTMTTRSLRLRQALLLLTGFAFNTQLFAVSPVTTYLYDAQGNLKEVQQLMNPSTGAVRVTKNDYDPLNRLKQRIDPMLGVTRYAYDGQDQIASVTDPRNNPTTYTTDGLGNQSQEGSPDRGATIQTFDEAGNLKTRTDARGKVVEYKYDALNRLTRIKTPGNNKIILFNYDQGPNALGRLSGISFPGGSTAYAYDPYGHVIQKTDTHQSGKAFSVRYGWNPDTGRLDSLTYPSGRIINFSYDDAGRINGISETTGPIATNIAYTPFGPPQSWTWGNGAPNTRSFDTDGRMTRFIALPENPTTTAVELDERILEYDDAGRLVSIQHAGNTNRTHNLGYDDLDRVRTWNRGTTSRAYNYDANGNREDLTISGTPYNYDVAPASNRLVNTQGPLPVRNFSYDAAGNILADGQVSYVYNDLGRLTEATVGTKTAKYTYDGLGQRIRKTGAGNFHYVYDEAGHLIGSYDKGGDPIQEYVYLGDMPLAVLSQAGDNKMVHYIYTDQIMKPWAITDVLNQAVWKWDTSPFGEMPASQNPEDLGAFNFNLRFPGQHYDKETGLFYNYFRDYDPQTGRYMQSDPIGLEGGMNTFAYVLNSPIMRIDPKGLDSNFGINEGGSFGFGGAIPLFRGLGVGGSVGFVARACCGPDNIIYTEYLAVAQGGPSAGVSGRISPQGIANVLRLGPLPACIAKSQSRIGLNSLDFQTLGGTQQIDLQDSRVDLGLTLGGGSSAVLSIYSKTTPLGKSSTGKECCEDKK
jgi:RHS repeat-associated protein